MNRQVYKDLETYSLAVTRNNKDVRREIEEKYRFSCYSKTPHMVYEALLAQARGDDPYRFVNDMMDAM